MSTVQDDGSSAQATMTVSLPTKIPKADLSHDEWLAIRKTGVGASDAAAAVGMNPWQTPLGLWREKVGIDLPTDLSDNEATELGNELEDWVARKFERRTGRKVRRDNFIRRSAEHPFMMCNLDRNIVAEDGGEPELLECKIAGARAALGDEWGEDGSDQVPERYLIQVQHQMIVTGRRRAYIAALLASTSFRIYEILFNPIIANTLITLEREFWTHVERGIAPIVASDEEARIAFPISEDRKIIATTDIIAADHKLRAIDEQLADLEVQGERLRAQIKGFMGSADTLVDARGQKLRIWKSRNAFSEALLREKNPELYAQFVEPLFNARKFRDEHAKLVKDYSQPSNTRVFRVAGDSK